MRVAVIGTGIVGACVGWHLSKGGAAVVFVDRRTGPGQGVSAWSLSWVNASSKMADRGYFDLNAEGLASYYQLAEVTPDDSWWHPAGHLRWADDAERMPVLSDTVQRLQSWGYDATLWDAASVNARLEPAIRFPAPDTPVAFFPREGWVDGPALVGLLVGDAVSRGAETRFGAPVTDLVVRGESVTEVVLGGGDRLTVDAVVNAAGPDAGKVASLVGRCLPMRDEPGLAARVTCGEASIGRGMHAPHVELRPDRPGQLLLHSREIDALLVPGGVASDDLEKRLHELGSAVCPGLRASTAVGARVSQRPVPGDGFPSVGAVGTIGGYYEAVTHSGITLGPVLGRVLALEMLQGRVDDLVASYRPARFGPGEPG